MDIKIFDSILHGVLKPWLVSFPETQQLKEIIRNADKIEPTNAKELQQKLQFLLFPFKELLQVITLSKNEDLKRLSYRCPVPEPLDLPTTYYKLFIDAEALRYFNAVINNPFIIDKDLDIPFQIEHKVLKSIATLANEAQTELIERGVTDETSTTLTLTQFALISLKNTLIALYFSVQEYYEIYLSEVYKTVDEFYLYKMDDNIDKVDLEKISTESSGPITIPVKPVTVVPPSTKLSFGWKGKSYENLIGLFDDLCIDINFIDEEKTTVETLVELFTSKEIIPGNINIYLACQTVKSG